MTKGIRVAEQICTLLGIRIAERSQLNEYIEPSDDTRRSP